MTTVTIIYVIGISTNRHNIDIIGDVNIIPQSNMLTFPINITTNLYPRVTNMCIDHHMPRPTSISIIYIINKIHSLSITGDGYIILKVITCIFFTNIINNL